MQDGGDCISVHISALYNSVGQTERIIAFILVFRILHGHDIRGIVQVNVVRATINLLLNNIDYAV